MRNPSHVYQSWNKGWTPTIRHWKYTNCCHVSTFDDRPKLLSPIVPRKVICWRRHLCGVCGEPNVFSGLWSDKVEGNLLRILRLSRATQIWEFRSLPPRKPATNFPPISWQFTTRLEFANTNYIFFYKSFVQSKIQLKNKRQCDA